MDKRTVTALFLIALVILAYQAVIIPNFVTPPEPLPQEAPIAVEGVAPEPHPVAVPAAALQTQPLPPPESLSDIPAAERISHRIDQALYSALLDTKRGSLRSWTLKNYLYGAKDKEHPGEPVELLFPREGTGALGLTFDPHSDTAFASPFAVEEEDGAISLVGQDSFGLVMKRTYRFHPDNYSMDLDITFENRSDTPRTFSWETFVGPDLDRYRGDSSTDRPEAQSYAGGELDKVKIKKAGQSKPLGPLSWVAVGDRYFVTALVVQDGSSLNGFVRKNGDERLEAGVRAESIALGPNQVITFKLLSYLGPKEQNRLAAFQVGLEKSINYGWFSWLALPFLSIMDFFHGFLRNWGLAILALTFLVKLCLFPISSMMYRSMRKMQTIQPKVQALKKKFKDDSKALQQATMELYKQHKVNPMAGCLPMFIQIPVFFALYRVLFNAIELRGAAFLYIPDLSQKDPYYIAPLLMGATMILQQKLSPTSADPKQARMMMFMPVIFTAMFLNFSSGLVLYFLFSNVISIGEQQLIRKWMDRSKPSAAQPPPPGKSGKKKKQDGKSLARRSKNS